jgi:outer membrane protein OmpA-like peptidoglycan-associated protein
MAAVILLTAGVGIAQEPDVAGGKDHPLFNRLPGYFIQRYEEKDFEAHTFKDSKRADVNVEGHYFVIRYSLQPGAKELSRIQIHRNYENAVLKIGGKVAGRDDDGNLYLTVLKDGKEIWIHVAAYITSEWELIVVEKQAMNQDIVANAAALTNDIKTSGHAAVYGIYFDFGKSSIKPESEPAISEVAKLLKNNSDLKLYLVGHTDNVGSLDSNMSLSLARAEAVAQVMILKQGIAASRLKGLGVGPLAPVASNDSEEGRAKNRRVELVKQ